MNENVDEDTKNKPKRVRKAKPEATCAIACSGRTELRDNDGLLKTVQYVKDKNGFVDWRAMINEDHIVLNRMEFAYAGIDVANLSEEELKKVKAEAPENKKLIKLAGFKDLSRLRGIKAQKFDLVDRAPEAAVVSCKLQFIPNYENPEGLVVEALAQASTENVGNTGKVKYQHYLEVIASNRAFVRCVKEALQILTLSEDEVMDEKVEIAVARPGSPQDVLGKRMAAKNLKIEDLRSIFQEMEGSVEKSGWQDGWINVESLPTSLIATLLPKLK